MTTEIFKCVAGSRLFGTAVPESDTDYKGIHVPSTRDILLGKSKVIESSTGNKVTKNTAADTDMVSFPIQRYLELVTKMETNAIEMLFAPNLIESVEWKVVYANRHRLLSSNKKAFTGFGKSQAMRYAMRGTRLDTFTAVCDILSNMTGNRKVSEQPSAIHFHSVPSVSIFYKTEHDGNETPYMDVLGKECSMNVKAQEALAMYLKPIKEAGQRSLTAQAQGGADWKGLYHAHRIVDEGLELFGTGNLSFPCKNAQEYLAIRSGSLTLGIVLDAFDSKLAALEAIEPHKALLEKADTGWIENFVYDIYRGKILRSA